MVLGKRLVVALLSFLLRVEVVNVAEDLVEAADGQQTQRRSKFKSKSGATSFQFD